MNKCDNCVHNGICYSQEVSGRFGIAFIDCKSFKSKSLFVELPCKVGDMIWFDTYKRGNSIGIQPHKVDRIDVVLVCGEKELIETKIPIWRIGKTVFLTKEEAERKLKEVGE